MRRASLLITTCVLLIGWTSSSTAPARMPAERAARPDAPPVAGPATRIETVGGRAGDARQSLRCFGERPTIVGTRRSEVITGTPRHDVIFGGGGSDVIRGRGGDDLLCGWKGEDDILGGSGQDALSGDRGDDTLHGDGGYDFVVGGSGDDTLDGGLSFDAVVYMAAPRGVSVDLAAGTATGEGDDSVIAVEDVWGSPFADTITGSATDGFYFPGDGDDVVDGGDGFDTVGFAAEPITVDLSAGSAAGEGSDALTNIEAALGTAGDDVLLGDSNGNFIDGRGGDDTISGQAGDDRLVGGAGNDTLDGGDGTDTLEGGDGTDTCTNGETSTACEA